MVVGVLQATLRRDLVAGFEENQFRTILGSHVNGTILSKVVISS